jgi:hypothetical protein
LSNSGFTHALILPCYSDRLLVAWLRSRPYLRGAPCFLLGGTEDWAGFLVTPAVARAIAGA